MIFKEFKTEIRYTLLGVCAALLWTLILISTMEDKTRAIEAGLLPVTSQSDKLAAHVDSVIQAAEKARLHRKIDSLQRLLSQPKKEIKAPRIQRPTVAHFGYGREISHLSGPELRLEMQKKGFRDLDELSKEDLRRVWLCWSYDPLLWDVHELTGLPVSVLFSYFVIEATKNGLESELLYKYGNPGGIKANSRVSESANFFDDCTDAKGRRIKCKFAVIRDYQGVVQAWSDVFNLPRYQKCKSAKGATPELTRVAVCQCLKKGGYHTATGKVGKDGIGSHVKTRARLAGEYWEIRSNHFPARYFWAGK